MQEKKEVFSYLKISQPSLVQNIPLDLEKSKAIAKQALFLGYGVLFTLDDSIKVYTKDHTFQN